jgi:hypothetical protein
VIVACSAIKFANGLYQELAENYPKSRILLITSENATETDQSNFLTTPNQYVNQWDIVIHTPAMESGVSIDEPRFKEVVGFCNAGDGTGTPSAFVQMLFRSRGVERISLWVDPQLETSGF